MTTFPLREKSMPEMTLAEAALLSPSIGTAGWNVHPPGHTLESFLAFSMLSHFPTLKRQKHRPVIGMVTSTRTSVPVNGVSTTPVVTGAHVERSPHDSTV